MESEQTLNPTSKLLADLVEVFKQMFKKYYSHLGTYSIKVKRRKKKLECVFQLGEYYGHAALAIFHVEETGQIKASFIFCHASLEPICIDDQRLGKALLSRVNKISTSFVFGHPRFSVESGQMYLAFCPFACGEDLCELLDAKQTQGVFDAICKIANQSCERIMPFLLYDMGLLPIAVMKIDHPNQPDFYCPIVPPNCSKVKVEEQLASLRDMIVNASSMDPDKFCKKWPVPQQQLPDKAQMNVVQQATVVQLGKKNIPADMTESALIEFVRKTFSAGPRGGFGCIFRAHAVLSINSAQTSRALVIKIDKRQQQNDTQKEIQAISRIQQTAGDCDFLAQYFVDPRFKNVLFSEYCPTQYSAFKSRPSFNIHCQFAVALQTSHALLHVQKSGIAHADIKPDNIVISSDQLVKIIDFGSATKFGDAPQHHTGVWSAPDKRITDKSDVYSFGMIMYDLFFNKNPIKGHGKSGSDIQRKRAQMLQGDYTILDMAPCSLKHLDKLIKALAWQCLQFEPEKRPPMQNVQHILLCLGQFATSVY